MEQRRKQGLKWLAGIGVASSPIVGCIVLTVVLLKRRKARRSRADEAANLERDSGIEIGEEAKLGNIDDPWSSSGKASKSTRSSESSSAAAKFPEPLPTTLMEETLPVTPRELWRLVMGNPDFMKSVSDTKKNRDLRIGRWRLSKGDTAVRKVSYVTPFKKQVIGPKEAKAIEVYESRGIPDQGFVVDVKVHTPEVPYGSSFHSHLQWDAISVGEKQTRLRVSCEVAFTKPCLVKGIVKKASLEGMKESYSRFREHLFGHLKMASGSPSASPSGNGRRPAAWQLLLLLLLGAAIFLAHMASTRYLHKEASLADHTAGRARYLLARRYLASAAAAPVQARMQATTQAALHAAEDGL